MNANTLVFVDTSAIAAFSLVEDEHHQSALRAAAYLSARHCRLVTSTLIVAETHALVMARAGRRTALQVIEEVNAGMSLIYRPSPQDDEHARSILSRYDDKDFSLTDAVSFAIIRREGIPLAFAFDRHFQQFGLTTVGDLLP